MADDGGTPRVRPLRADEAAELQRFYNATNAAVRRLFCPMGQEATLAACEEICGQVGQGARLDVVLEVNGEIAGWAFVSHLDTPRAYLGIGLTDRYCGRGLGQLLMAAVMDEARRLGKEAVDLIVVRENLRAQRLYERFGFEVNGGYHGADGQDYFTMAAPLPPSSGAGGDASGRNCSD